MSEVTLYPTPRWSDVVREQIRVVGLSLRREALVVAALLVVGTVLIASDIVRGRSGFDGDEMFPTALVALLVPFAIWRSDERFGAAFLWTLPVDRRRLALAKVCAGGVWLLAALAFFALWLSTLALLGRTSPAPILMRIPFTITIAFYLLSSAILLGLRHPLRWLFGAAGLLFVVGGVSDALEPYYGVHTLLGSARLFWAAEDSIALWRTRSGFTQWAISTFVLVGAGLIALWAALSRHVERRRR